MSSSKSYDTDKLTIRQVFAYNQNNTVIPALQVLTSDGHGGTFWAVPSSLGGIPVFNEVIINGVPITATLSHSTITLNTSDGLGSILDPATNNVRLISKAFAQIDISGGNSIVGYSNGILTPNVVKFAGCNGFFLNSDPFTNTIYIYGDQRETIIYNINHYLASTVQGLGSSDYISSYTLQASLASTNKGLGMTGYISSLNNVALVSALQGNFSSISAITINATNIFVNGFPVLTGSGNV